MTRLAGVPVLVAVAAALVLGATGCAAAPPASTPEPAPTAEPSPSATPAGDPQPLLDLDCSDLSSASEISAALGGELELVDATRPGWGQGYPQRPLVLRQLGGLVCEWASGPTPPADAGPGSIEPSLVATLVLGPDAVAKHQRYNGTYGIDDEVHCVEFSAGDDIASCAFSMLVDDDAWVEVHLDARRAGATSAEARAASLQPLADRFAATVSAAGPGAPLWAPPDGTPALSDDCKSYVAGDALDAALEPSAPLVSFEYRDGPQIDQTMDLDGRFLVLYCSWFYQQSEWSVGALSAWPGGEWAWRELTDGGAGSTELQLEGLAPDDRAWLDCADGDTTCTADLLLRHNWIRLSLNDPDPDLPVDQSFAADKATALRTLAAEVVANLR